MPTIEEIQAELLKFRNSQPEEGVSTSDIWHTTYLGVPAIQAWQDFMLWERFLNQANNPGRLIEIGTFVGGLSLYLLSQSKARAMVFHTMDIDTFVDLDKLPELVGHFILSDVFSDEGKAQVKSMIDTRVGDRPVILLCDGGNKPKEMQTFVPMLHPGDYAVVHDWGNEVGEGDLEAVKDMLEPIMEEDCANLHSLTRFFRRK